MFQSSPGLPAGCNAAPLGSEHTGTSFQSSPGLPAGCNDVEINGFDADGNVSILTRPPGRMQPVVELELLRLYDEFQSSPGLPAGCNFRAHAPVGGAVLVSILTRPPGRMQPAARTHSRYPVGSFNPHPASRPDATQCRWRSRCCSTCFNPHPASRPDATIRCLDGHA